MSAFDNPSGAAELQLKAILDQTGEPPVDVTNMVTWGSSDPTVGTVDGSGMFHGWTTGRTFITASLDTIVSAPVLVVIADTTGQEPLSGQSILNATNDVGISEGMHALLDELDRAGISTTDLRDADNETRYHEEGVNSGGVTVPSDAGGITYLPGLSGGDGFWFQSILKLVIVYDGKVHVVHKSGTAQDLRDKNFTDSDSVLTSSATTGIHELIHSLIYHCHVGVGNDKQEEILVQDLEILIRDLVTIHKSGGSCRTPLT
jgi:hypothetical protein